MTKYILAGGCDRSYLDYGKRLAEVVNREVSNPKILSCFFSSSKETRKEREDEWGSWFKKYFANSVVSHASEETFFEQLNEADVLYLHGGATTQLIESLPDFHRLKEAIKGKVIIGSSAGANYLSKIYYSPLNDSIKGGSGIIDVNTIVHYGIESFDKKEYTPEQWQDIVKRVNDKTESGHVVLLPEGNFTVIEAE